MSKLLDEFNLSQLKKIPDVRPGDTIKVHQKVKEGTKERVQIFEGVVIAKKHGVGLNATITVRKAVDSIGVERIFPLHAPFIEKIEILRSGKARRSKLYFLRDAKGKKSRLKVKKVKDFSAAIVEDSKVEPVVESLPEVSEKPTESASQE